MRNTRCSWCVMQAQNIEISAVPAFSWAGSGSDNSYPGTIRVVLHSYMSGTVCLGDHLHVTGVCRGSGIHTSSGVEKLPFAAFHVSHRLVVMKASMHECSYTSGY